MLKYSPDEFRNLLICKIFFLVLNYCQLAKNLRQAYGNYTFETGHIDLAQGNAKGPYFTDSLGKFGSVSEILGLSA